MSERTRMETALNATMLEEFRDAQTKNTEGWNRVVSNLTNDVISSGLHVIGATGYFTDGFPVPYGSMFVVNHSDFDMVITSGTPVSNTAPTAGTGVSLVPANSSRVINQVGTAYSIYGQAGDFASVEIFSKSQPPVASSVETNLVAANLLTVTTGTNPAAGAEWTATVPAGESWQLNTVRYTLVTSAAVANRLTTITFDNGTTVFARFSSTQTQPASITTAYTAAVDVASSGLLGTEVLLSIPRLIIPSGYRISSLTVALDVADDYTAPVFYYTRFV